MTAESVHEALLSLFQKAGYEVIYPEGLSTSCCGELHGCHIEWQRLGRSGT